MEKWKLYLVLIVCLVSVYLSLPSILWDNLGGFSPYFLNSRINLGLDLRGGSSLLLEVDNSDYQSTYLQYLAEVVNSKFPEANAEVREEILFCKSTNDIKLKKVLGEEIPKDHYNILSSDDGYKISLTEQWTTHINSKLVEQSIQVIQKRVDEHGTREVVLQRQGRNNIILGVPGVYDPTNIKRLLGSTAKLGFYLVNTTLSKQEIESRMIPSNSRLLQLQDKPDLLVPVYIAPYLSGEMLVDAQAGLNGVSYGVNFKFNSSGTKILATITTKNVQKPLAIVLDNQILSLPTINEPILTGSGFISGNFTLKQANEMAIMLRSGALPTKLNVIEERTIGPTLGADSIAAGKKAVIVACVGVMITMILFYGILGVFADIALIINLIMIIAVLSLFEATLTMPGIAGIALTLGMAVDANVLIYERMKDEAKKHQKRSLGNIMESSYKLATATILDSNLTTIAAAVILYIFGTGMIRGFAVTLITGILCSLFTSITLTKALSYCWYSIAKR